QIAVEQREVAETERQNAERQQQIAVEQKRNADRLRLLSVARSLAIQATQVQPRDEQRQLVALLALQAFRFNERYGGSPLESDIYNALQVANSEFGRGTHDVLRAHSAGVRAVTFAPEGNQLVSGGEDGAVYLWDISPRPDPGQSARLLLRRHGSGIRHVRFAGSGQLAVGATSGRVWRWDGALDKAPQSLMGTPPKAIGALDYAPAGRLLAAGLDGWLRVWDTDQIEAQPLASNAALGRLHGLAVSTEYLVAGGDSGHIEVWDAMGEQQVPQRVEVGKTSVRCLAFSPDGRRLVAGTQGGDLLVWQSGDWQAEPQQLIGHISTITGLAFNGAGDLLASSSLDRSVRLWSVDEGTSIAIAQDDWVWDVAFSPDDNRLASAGADRTVRLWYADVRDLARAVATRVERDMTEAEWKNFVGEDIPYEVTRKSSLGGAQ
ncbi:MAG: WD40 repeat domain-containing protein, partial [Candidatus Latescibacteria bacterium]|nr:WD40 repeat domain-containing protein [Candidatus Latescibacterota bacterium]